LSIRSIEARQALQLISNIQADLERLRGLIQPSDMEFDPKDSRNKTPDGKLTPRGVEVCYRLFEAGKTRYAVASAMNISFGAATHRLNAWKNAGGKDRKKMRLD
jgi:DNA-binding NarL/FixJ family response regulator